MKVLKLLNIIAQVIYDKKGFNILALDLKRISTITDYIIIAEGNVSRHVRAIAQEIIKELYKFKEPPFYVEGLKEGTWVVIDYFDIIVHILIPEIKEKYHLEKLWKNGKIVNLKIKVNSKSFL